MVCLYPILLICSSVDGHLGCFHFFAIVTNAVMNTGVHISLSDSAFNSFGYISRSSKAAVTKYHKLNGLNNRYLLSHGSGGKRLEMKMG